MGFKKWYSLGSTGYTYVQGQVQQYVSVFWEYGFSSGATYLMDQLVQVSKI